jgi:hypothetical protein
VHCGDIEDFFTGGLICGHSAAVLNLQIGDVLWERFFYADDRQLMFTGTVIPEFFNNLHVWDPGKDHSISIDKDSDLDKSFFKEIPPERSYVLEKEVNFIGPLFWILIEFVALAWSPIGETICVPLDILRKGAVAASDYVKQILRRKHSSMAPAGEKRSAVTYFKEGVADADDPGYLHLNPQLIATFLMKIKAWAAGKSLSKFIRENIVKSGSGRTRLSFRHTEMVQNFQIALEEWVRDRWLTLTRSYVLHWSNRGRCEQANLPGNFVNDGDYVEDTHRDAEVVDGGERREVGGAQNVITACCYGPKCVWKETKEMLKYHSKKDGCGASEWGQELVYKLCVQRFLENFKVRTSQEMREWETEMGDDLDCCVCLLCHATVLGNLRGSSLARMRRNKSNG